MNIPADVRNRLGLASGVQSIVLGENDVVILKTIKPPSMADFDGIIPHARRQAKTAGMMPADITRAVAKVRGREVKVVLDTNRGRRRAVDT